MTQKWEIWTIQQQLSSHRWMFGKQLLILNSGDCSNTGSEALCSDIGCKVGVEKQSPCNAWNSLGAEWSPGLVFNCLWGSERNLSANVSPKLTLFFNLFIHLPWLIRPPGWSGEVYILCCTRHCIWVRQAGCTRVSFSLCHFPYVLSIILFQCLKCKKCNFWK